MENNKQAGIPLDGFADFVALKIKELNKVADQAMETIRKLPDLKLDDPVEFRKPLEGEITAEITIKGRVILTYPSKDQASDFYKSLK